MNFFEGMLVLIGYLRLLRGDRGESIVYGKKSFFSKIIEMVENGLLCVKRTWDSTNHQCGIVNVYSPCSLSEKKSLWDKIEDWMS